MRRIAIAAALLALSAARPVSARLVQLQAPSVDIGAAPQPPSGEFHASTFVFGGGIDAQSSCVVFTDLDDGGSDALRIAVSNSRCTHISLAAGLTVALTRPLVITRSLLLDCNYGAAAVAPLVTPAPRAPAWDSLVGGALRRDAFGVADVADNTMLTGVLAGACALDGGGVSRLITVPRTAPSTLRDKITNIMLRDGFADGAGPQVGGGYIFLDAPASLLTRYTCLAGGRDHGIIAATLLMAAFGFHTTRVQPRAVLRSLRSMACLALLARMAQPALGEPRLLVAMPTHGLTARAAGAARPPQDGPSLVLAVATHPAHFFLLNASRDTWRKGVRTVVSVPGDGPETLLDVPFPDEVWVQGPDGTGYGWEGRGGNKAEQRCTGVVRVANLTAGPYDWVLNADDDVVWLMDNVRALLERLDADKPYFITDGFLNDVWTGCAFEDAADAPLVSSRDGRRCERAVPNQPCTRAVLQRPNVCASDVLSQHSAGEWIAARAEVAAYGNSGYVVSRGLLRSISEGDFYACEMCNTSRFRCMHGADFRLGECFLAFGANGAGIGPTVPRLDGLGLFGHSFVEVEKAAQHVASGGVCDARCAQVLRSVVSVHLPAHSATPEAYAERLRGFMRSYLRAKELIDAPSSATYTGSECHPGQALPVGGGCALWRTGVFRRSSQSLSPPAELNARSCGAPNTTFADGRFASGLWMPASCELAHPEGDQLRAALAGRRLLFQGDSMIRQMFNALVFMVRSEDTIVDPWFHSDATYSFNDTHDAYVCAATEPGADALPDAVFTAKFVWDPQMRAAAAVDASAWDAVVASPVHWSEAAELDALAALASPNTVYVTTPASAHVNNANVTARNAWIEARAPRFVPLNEMDASGVYGRDVPDHQHFQCQSLTPLGESDPERRLKTPKNGDCRDAVNRNAVAIVTQLARTQTRAPGASLFSYDAARGASLLDPFSPGDVLPEAFAANFERCMRDPVKTTVTNLRYGPYARDAPRRVPGFRRASALHPTLDMADAPLEPAFGAALRLPSAEWFSDLVLNTFKRSTPVIMHCFASDYGGKGVRAGRHGFFPMLLSWLGHVARVGRLDHVLVVGQSLADCALVTDFAPCLVHSAVLGYPDAMNAYAQNFRWVYSDLLLRGGIAHVSTDADAFLMADPMPALAAVDADVAGLSDRLYDGAGPLGYCDEPNDPCQSTGFTLLRPAPDVLRLVGKFTRGFTGGFEQQLFNQQVASELVVSGRYHLLPNSGDAAFANWNVVLPAIKEGLNLTLVVMHMGGQQGGVPGAAEDGKTYWMDSKEFLFRCAEVWLDETNMAD